MASSIVAKTRVNAVHAVSGEIILGFTLDTSRDRLVVLLALQKVCARRCCVPETCMCCWWTQLSCSRKPMEAVSSVIIKPFAEQIWDTERDTEDDVNFTCMSCGDPCEDADSSKATRSRTENCQECSPCSLCEFCRVLTKKDQHWICFLCIENNEDLERCHWNTHRSRLLRRFWHVRPDLHDCPFFKIVPQRWAWW